MASLRYDLVSLLPRLGTNRTMPVGASPYSQCQNCLDRFENLTSLDGCGHRLCFWWVHRWSNNAARCPLCKQPFLSISFARCPSNIEAYDQHAKYDGPAPSHEEGSRSESAGIGQAHWGDEASGPSSSSSKQVRAARSAAWDTSEDGEPSGKTVLVGLQRHFLEKAKTQECYTQALLLSPPATGTDKDEDYRLPRKRKSEPYARQHSYSREYHPRKHRSIEKQNRKRYCNRHKSLQGQKRMKTQDRSLSPKIQAWSLSSESRMCRDASRSRSRSSSRSESTDSAYYSGGEEDQSTYKWNTNNIDMISTDQDDQKYTKQSHAHALACQPQQPTRPDYGTQSLSERKTTSFSYSEPEDETQRKMRRKRSRSQMITYDENPTNAKGLYKKKKKREKESHQSQVGYGPFSSPAPLMTIDTESDEDKENQDSTECDSNICSSSRLR